MLATAAALAAGLAAISRRRPLEGLLPAEDGAVREVAANRLFRTGVLHLLGILGAAWSTYVALREGRDRLAGFVPDHPAALSLAPHVDLLAAVDIGLNVVTLLIAVALLLWRSPALHVLQSAPAGPAERPA